MTNKSNRKAMQSIAGVALLLFAVGIANADTLVTFQVDMSVVTTNGSGIFDPSTQTVAARGTFSGWNAFPLTNNPTGANSNLYTGTTNVAGNGSVMQFKYTIEPGAHYESVVLGGSHNRLVTLPSNSGASLVVPVVYYNDTAPDNTPAVPVTFRVNLAQQINVGAFIPDTSLVYVRGSFNGYGLDTAMTNDPSIRTTNQFGLVNSNVYVMSYDITGSPGQTTDYKYYIDTGVNWESPGPGVGDPNDNNNRFFNLGAAPQTLPIIFFNDAPYAPIVTNNVTFQVDMSAQALIGAFDPSTGTVELRGNFNSWGTPQILCTNDVNASNTNLYKTVVTLTNGVGASFAYKFWASIANNGGYETFADNRIFFLANASSQTLPPVFFNDQALGDYLPDDTLVTFNVNMTGAVGTDAHVFDPSLDQVFINGINILNGAYRFLTWDTSLPQLVENPVGSTNYTLDVTLPKGSPVALNYKYGINGVDDEAGANANHVRFVRTTGTYALPRDTFGSQLVEPSFGQLKADAAVAGHVPVSWLGRPGVYLQTGTNLLIWTTLADTAGLGPPHGLNSTNGFVSVTNWPSSGKAFFRLVKP